MHIIWHDIKHFTPTLVSPSILEDLDKIKLQRTLLTITFYFFLKDKVCVHGLRQNFACFLLVLNQNVKK